MQPVSERVLTQACLDPKPGLCVPLSHLPWDGKKASDPRVRECVGGLLGVGPCTGPTLTLYLHLLGNEHSTTHQLQKERHVLGRGGEALPKGPGDCALQRAPHVKGRQGLILHLPQTLPQLPHTSPQTQRS